MTRQQALSMLDDSPIAALYKREALTIFTYVLLSRSFHFLRTIYKQQEGGHDNP